LTHIRIAGKYFYLAVFVFFKPCNGLDNITLTVSRKARTMENSRKTNAFSVSSALISERLPFSVIIAFA
jgi:hypothetical protein